jgi:alginate O-acetyltransferase complex protein AlgI
MLFNSFEYALFFIAVLVAYFRLPVQPRWPILLVASYIFYMGWRPLFALLLMFSSVVDFIGALVIDSAAKPSIRRLALAASISINLGLLAFFKYYNFFAANVQALGLAAGYDFKAVYLDLILPLGISFYTFQSLSYVFDVYARRLPAERNLLRYALYLAFFPKLESGPIEQAVRFIPQLHKDKFANPQRFRDGLWLISYGLFKKMCISDSIAPFVNGIYAEPQQFNGSYQILATALFAVQIYCDFSGYSDIAIGCARMLGFDLMTNFRQPYFSRSLTEFWRRWHISLSSWFFDYLYFPIGGIRQPLGLYIRNIMIVFLLCGLWHGAAWTFVIWGAWHGAILCVERTGSTLLGRTSAWHRFTASPRSTFLLGAAGLLWTNTVVLVGCALFRARSFADALTVVTGVAHLGRLDYGTLLMLRIPPFFAVLSLGLHITLLFVIDFLLFARPDILARLRAIRFVAIGGAVALFYDIVLFGVFERTDFIYFQF